MILMHGTTKERYESIKTQGLLVSKADPAAKLRGVWAASPSNAAWTVLHCQRKHKANLDDVVVLEIEVSRKQLRRFKRGIWVSSVDVPATAIRRVIPGSAFGASASE